MRIAQSRLPVDLGFQGSEWAESLPEDLKFSGAFGLDAEGVLSDQNDYGDSYIGRGRQSFNPFGEIALKELILSVDTDFRERNDATDEILIHSINLRRGYGCFANNVSNIFGKDYDQYNKADGLPRTPIHYDGHAAYSMSTEPTTQWYEMPVVLPDTHPGQLTRRQQRKMRYRLPYLLMDMQARQHTPIEFEPNHLLLSQADDMHGMPAVSPEEVPDRAFFRDFVSVLTHQA